jgi:hypothetical protein
MKITNIARGEDQISFVGTSTKERKEFVFFGSDALRIYTTLEGDDLPETLVTTGAQPLQVYSNRYGHDFYSFSLDKRDRNYLIISDPNMDVKMTVNVQKFNTKQRIVNWFYT